MIKNDNTLDYYTKSQQWRDDIYYGHQVKLRWSFLLNGILLTLLLISTIAFALLLPLKQSVPFILNHNQTTGEITQLGELKPDTYANDWTLSRYFIIRYITERESFHLDNLERPYQIAYAMSDNAIAQEYAKQADSNNPNSPYNLYGQHKFVTVHINSVAKLNDNTAEVHFEKTIHDKTSGQQLHIPMVSILKWRYSPMRTTQKVLDRNPLGFQVTYYHPSQVTLESK